MSSSEISPQKESHDIMHWLLAISEVVNAGSRLAPQKATQKRLQEMVNTYGAENVWETIKQVSTILSIGNAPYAETQFRSYPNLPAILQTEESAKKINQWFKENSAIVDDFHRLFCGLGKLVVPTITNKFAKGETTPEQKEILGKVSQILEKEDNNEESGNLHTSL